MIDFYYEGVTLDFNENKIIEWLLTVAQSEGKTIGEITFIFCDDEYLLDINKRFLNHDYYTDIITFDNTIGNQLGADVFISSQRVRDNANSFNKTFNNELLRVLVHGVLHLCGYKDKSDDEAKLMRSKEEEKIMMFHVEH